MSKKYSLQLEAAIASGKGGSFRVLSPKDLALKNSPRSKSGTPRDVLKKIEMAMKSSSALDMNLSGMRDLEPFRKVLKGLTPRQVDVLVTKMNRPPFDMPIRIEYSPSGSFKGKSVFLVDGRHRLQAAREFGASKIKARVMVRGEDGDVISDSIEIIPTGGKKFKLVQTDQGRELKRR